MSSVLTYNGHGLKLMTGSGYVRVSGEKYDPVPKAEIVFRFSSSSTTHSRGTPKSRNRATSTATRYL